MCDSAQHNPKYFGLEKMDFTTIIRLTKTSGGNMYKYVIATVAMLFFVGCMEPGLEKYNEALKYQQTNQIELAEQSYKISLQENPELAESHLNLGVIYMNKEWYEGALASTEKAIAIFNNTQKTFIDGSTVNQVLAIAKNNIGIIKINLMEGNSSGKNISVIEQEYDAALAEFSEAIQLDPQCAEANANLAKFTKMKAEYINGLKMQALGSLFGL